MDMELIIAMLAGVFGLVVLALCFVQMGKAIWSCFAHTSWDKDANPDPDAIIVDINSQQVKYVKNGAKFKTTVVFSDGFTYVTHKTNRENHFGSYTISVNRKEIAEAAKLAHAKAVEKKGVKAAPAPVPVVQEYPATTPVAQSKPAQDDYPATAPVTKAQPAQDDYPTTAPVTKAQPAVDDYPTTAPVTKAQPAQDDYPTTAPVTKAQPAQDDYPTTAPVTKAQPAQDDYPTTAPVTQNKPAVVISAVEKAIPPVDDYPKTVPVSQSKPAQDYPATAPVSDFRPPVTATPAADPVPETTRWICPRCGLVHNKALAVCFHCGTPQSAANKFV